MAKRSWRHTLQWILKLLAAANPLPDLAYFGGILLIGYGAYQYDPRIGAITLGALLLLSIKPLVFWIK